MTRSWNTAILHNMHKPRRLSLIILAEINLIGSITQARARVLSQALENRTDRGADVLSKMRVNGYVVRDKKTGAYVRP